ncbi:MAG TPA: cell division protein CrgA [Micromonosporaceae bacterium]|nr:cell division protein CrgA [Micromonosporaceae bacterium]
MPKSHVRKKKVYTPQAHDRPLAVTAAASKKPSPILLPISAVTLIVLGITWLVVFYLSQGVYPVLSWGYWNIAIGFGAMVTALGLLTRWR